MPQQNPLGESSTVSQTVVTIEYGGKDLVRLPSEKSFTPKEIKTLLINEIAMTLQDLESIQKAELPKEVLFHSFQISLPSGVITLGHFPTLVCTEAASLLYAAKSEVGLWTVKPSSVVDVSASSHSSSGSSRQCQEKKDRQSQIFLGPVSMTYQQFLVSYCKHHLFLQEPVLIGYRIDFELYIFSFPLLFGKATVMQEERRLKTFFFARSLSCLETCKLLESASEQAGIHHNFQASKH